MESQKDSNPRQSSSTVKSFQTAWMHSSRRKVVLAAATCAVVSTAVIALARPMQVNPNMEAVRPPVLIQPTHVPEPGEVSPPVGARDFAAINAERKKEISDDSTKLLQLATDLKAAVDKTNKDTLSVDVIKKADEIEKLAKSVRKKMKASIGN